MVITATQIKIKSILGFIRFIPRIRNIKSQLSKVDGLLFVEFNGFRTLTGWESLEAMKAFRRNGHHLDAMKNVKHIGKSKSVTWETELKPNWNQVKEKLNEIQFNA
ncbi:MAG: hypothetical protein KAT25_03735 [Sulfuriflexus sp.]|nr:hypothetical protein [Sulfuriflexus sp.]